MIVQRVTTLALAVSLFWAATWPAPAKRQSAQHTGGAVTTMFEMPVQRGAWPRWCYDDEVAFVFAQGRAILKVSVPSGTISRHDLPYAISSRSLSCTFGGRFVSVLNAAQDRLRLINLGNGTQSEYAITAGRSFPIR